MATETPIKIQIVKSLSTAQPSRIVAVKADGDTAFSLWVTDKTGIPYPLKDLQNNVIITNTDGNLQITSSSTSTNINLASSILATINSALQSGDNISELVNNVGYLTTFTETDPVFQASEASLFVSGDKFNLDNQSGINSGDQDSIVGISGTKAQFNTELTDGDFLFVGDVSETPDATTIAKGKVKLAGDLGGTADNPTTPTAIHKIGDEIKHGILTLSDGLKIVGNTTSTTAAKVNVQEADGIINTIAKSDLIEVLEFDSAVSMPITGVSGKIYVTKDNNKIYRWNGTIYQELAVTDITYQSVINALTFTPENVANKATTLTASSTLYPNNDAVIAGLATKEDKANKVTSIGSPANDTNYPSELAVKTYADNLVVGMLNDRGTWDASVNVFPATGGSGVGGVIRKGDMWYVSVAGTLGAKLVNVGDSFRALVNAPAQVAANWSILEANIGYVPANDNAVVHLAGTETITGQKTFSPTISASGAIARGTYLTPSLTATADNDVLVGLDINTTFTNGAFTGTKSLPVRVTSNQYIGMNVSRNSTGGSAITISNNNGGYNFGVGSINEFFIQRAGGNIVNAIFPTGNSVIQNGGAFTDDNINRLQVTGTISSGTTTLGNTPPTANNQLTRKDYVDTGLAGREPSFTKNTAFNKNFGTTAGTVVEGNDSRINNGQTAFGWGNHAGLYPLYNGTGASGIWNINVTGSANLWNGLGRTAGIIANPGYIMTTVEGGVNAGISNLPQMQAWLGLGSNAYTSTAYLPLSGGTLSGAISGTSATFSSTVSASPATASNHLVTKAQLDAVANTTGTVTSGSYTPTLSYLANISNGRFDSASYTRIGNVVTARVSLFITATTPSATAILDFLLPVPRVSTNVTGIGLGSSFEASTVVNTNDNTTTARLAYQPLVPYEHQVIVMFQYLVN